VTVVEEAGPSATVYIVTENRDETVAVITASNWGKGRTSMQRPRISFLPVRVPCGVLQT
jgi:hypothetical protein